MSSPSLPLAFFLLFSSTLFITTSHGLKITTRLIHRDSPLSPLYDPTQTIADRARKVIESSLARHAYLSSYDGKPSASLAPAIPHAVFFVNFSVGNPPIQQMAVMDTGSGLTWVKCLPCGRCLESSAVPVFDPTESRTNKAVPCSFLCRKCTAKQPYFRGGGWRHSREDCMYSSQYADGSVSEGVYVTDQLTFGDVTVPNVLLGCASSVAMGVKDLNRRSSGILALAFLYPDMLTSYETLAERMGRKFSYCTGSISDSSYPYNRLSFDESANLLGESTPFRTLGYGYFVDLVNISLGGLILDIEGEVLDTMSRKKGILMDSGTELMYLYTEAFDVVKAEVQKLASSVLTEVPPWVVPQFELCYEGSVEREATGFPGLALHFRDDVYMGMDSKGMFFQVNDGVFCLAILRTPGQSVIGMMAQQGYNVGYDLNARKVYFQNMDCEVLDDGL